MKIRYILAVLSISLVGCAEQYNYSVESECNNEANNNVSSGLTKSVCNNDIDSVFFVSENDLDSYLKFKKLSQKKEELTVLDIAAITDESGDIWAYAINYSEGWELISADKRYHPVIAQSPVGYFKYEEQIDPIAEWLGSYSEDIRLLRYMDDLSEAFTESSFEQMASYQEFWNSITASPDYIEEKSIERRLRFDPNGTWELFDVIVDTVGYYRVDHLITTHWHQNSPYNSFCPFRSYSLIDRAPAGCIAIAGAQTAYYLHGKIGLPVQSPLNALCSAQIPTTPGYYVAYPNDPQMYVYNFSSTAWNQMTVDDDVVAALIANVGICSSMKYKDSSSSATIGSLINGYFSNNGIIYDNSLLNDYTCLILYYNIRNELPVVAIATCNINGNDVGHAFIIDGYKNERLRITTIYTWVPDDPQNGHYYEDRLEITYSLPFNDQITMNWGWGNDYPYDAGWYSAVGDWHVASYNFNNNKGIVYNFSAP